MAKVTPAAEAEAETETKYGRGYFMIEQPPSWVPACGRLIGQRVDDTIVVPGLYLRASNELMFSPDRLWKPNISVIAVRRLSSSNAL